MLAYLLDRLELVRGDPRVVVATSTKKSDNPINSYCITRHIECYRGSLDDVAGRIVQVLEQTCADAFVRISADSPLIDPALVERALSIYHSSHAELVTNVLKRSYPKGMSVEVIEAEAFKRAYTQMVDAEDREHVTPIFYRNPGLWQIKGFSSEQNLEKIRFCVDTQADFDAFKAVLGQMTGPHWTYGLKDILALTNARGFQSKSLHSPLTRAK